MPRVWRPLRRTSGIHVVTYTSLHGSPDYHSRIQFRSCAAPSFSIRPSEFGNSITEEHMLPRSFATSLLLLIAAAAMLAQVEAPPSPKVKLYMPYKEYSQADNKKILAMFEDLRVADVSDGMDVVGLANVGIVNAEIKALWRDTENFTHRIVGVAVTERYVPTNKREIQMDKKTIDRWYQELTPETFQQMLFRCSILVIDAAEDGESRSIGSNNIMQWHKKGMLGVVVVPREHAAEVAQASR